MCDTGRDAGCDTPPSAVLRQRHKGGVAPVSPLSAGAVRVGRSRTRNPNKPVHGHLVTNRHLAVLSASRAALSRGVAPRRHATRAHTGGTRAGRPRARRGVRWSWIERPGGRCIRHAPEATPRAVGPWAVPVIEPAFQAPLMPRGRAPPLVPLRGRAATIPTVGLPPVAGPTEVEHRPAPRPAAAQRQPQRGFGDHARSPPRLRRMRGRPGVTWETDRTAWEDGRARPGGLRSRAHGSRRLRDRKRSRPSRRAPVGVKISASEFVESGLGDLPIP